LGAFFIIIIDDHVSQYQRFLVSLGVLFILQFGISYLCRLAVGWFSRKNSVRKDIIRIDTSPDNEEELYRQIRQAYPTGKPIYIRPRVYDLLTGAAQIQNLDDEAWICITDMNMSDCEICLKRTFDILASSLSLIALSPLFAVLAVAVRCSSKGPVFYTQERIGLYGHPFRIYKFRTMVVSAEQDGTPQLSRKDDKRITKIGHLMRKYRLDELPQLWNVLKGDMSFVGPRPERPYFIHLIEQQAPYYCLLYKIRPGLTSWGPIRVGYTDTIEKMIRRLNYDIAYMENMSLLLDLKIMLLTISVIFNGKGQ
jgi:exopolysaccharide biosynthesis polyprenyl glycosylphosphotransferase